MRCSRVPSRKPADAARGRCRELRRRAPGGLRRRQPADDGDLVPVDGDLGRVVEPVGGQPAGQPAADFFCGSLGCQSCNHDYTLTQTVKP